MQKVAVTTESDQPLTKVETPGQQQQNIFQQLLAQVTEQPSQLAGQAVSAAETKTMSEKVPAEITAMLSQLITGEITPKEVPEKLRPEVTAQLTVLVNNLTEASPAMPALSFSSEIKQPDEPESQAGKVRPENHVLELVGQLQLSSGVAETTKSVAAAKAQQQELAQIEALPPKKVLTKLTELVHSLQSLVSETTATSQAGNLEEQLPVADENDLQLMTNQSPLTVETRLPGKQAVRNVDLMDAGPLVKIPASVQVASREKAETKPVVQQTELDLSSLVDQLAATDKSLLTGKPASLPLETTAMAETSPIKQVAQQLKEQLSPVLEKSMLTTAGSKQTMILNLKPANLGMIKVVVQTSAQTVGLKFEVQNATTKDLLQKVTQQLEQILDQFQTEPAARQLREITPLKVAVVPQAGQAQVDAQTGDLMQDHQQAQRQFNRSPRTKTPRVLPELAPVTAEKHERDGVISLLV